jgi:hypothetical protein
MDGETFSLYLDLFEGGTADLEVVSRASLAFVAALKEAAFVIDPSLEIKIALESGSEGSLTLNTIIKSLKALTPDKTTLRALIMVALGWFASDARQYLDSHLFDRYLASDSSLSQQQKDEIRAIVADILGKNVAGTQVQSVYRELGQDPAIKGVGATTEKDVVPDHIVPRERFAERGGGTIVESVTETRTTTAVRVITLISPVLIHADRGWRFSADGIEFSAKIADKTFFEDALAGRTNIPLREGIHLTVEMKTDEIKEGGVWVVTKRAILKVIHIAGVPRQASLDLPSGRE